jgi:hypothetical protein
MNPPSFGFPEGLGNFSFSTNHVVDTICTSSLLETSMAQVTPNQPFVHTYPFAHGSCIIIVSLFTLMHTPSDLLGHSISQMVDSQVVHKTTVT